MTLSPMRYKDYIWPHNPRVYSIRFQRRVAAIKNPSEGYQLQDLGVSHRVMEGEGEFAGPDAYGQFRKLASVFADRGPGLLVHPLWQVANTYFVSLRVEQAPRPDYVKYSFAFWEENSLFHALAVRAAEPDPTGAEGGGAARPDRQARYHRVVKGDTMWELARTYGLSLAELVALNPQIKNPNLIRVGEEVRVA